MFSMDGYRAIRTTAALVPRMDRAILGVSGQDRTTWLQGLVTNDVVSLPSGERRYAAYLTPQGRMITDAYLVALPDRLLLEVPAPLAASLRGRLDGLIFAEDVQVVDESARMAVWGVYGPDASAVRSAGPSGPAFPDPSFGVPGVIVYLDRAQAMPATLAALPQVELETLDVVRIEAGTPRFLVDMTEDSIPLEAGIEGRAISFTKGCYVGQEVIVRVTTRGGGRVAKKLVRLWIDGIGDRGSGVARLFSGDRDIGRVTSAAFSPDQNRVVALGYVHRDFVSPGTEVMVVWDDARTQAVVAADDRPSER